MSAAVPEPSSAPSSGTDATYPVNDNVTNSDTSGATILDPDSATSLLYSLLNMQDRTLQQVRLIDEYITQLSMKFLLASRHGGYVANGLLLLTRKCVAEGIGHVFLLLTLRQHQQTRRYYNYIRHAHEEQEDLLEEQDLDESHDHVVMQIARGLSAECCGGQRSC